MPAIDKPSVFDLHPADLPGYQGRNPRPADFDTYWDNTLAELAETPAAVQIEAASIQIPGYRCGHLTFTGLGGARIYAKFIRPEQSHPDGNPGMCCFHGYSGSSGEWLSYLPYAALGFFVLAMDCRGQAGLSEDSGDTQRHTHRGQIVRGAYGDPRLLRFRYIFSDAARLVHLLMAMPEVDAGRIAVSGGSQGGALSIAAAALVPEVACATFHFPFLCDYLRIWELDLAEDGAYQEIGDLIKKQDPTGSRLDLLFHNLGYIDVAHLAPRIRARCLMGTGLRDRITPPSTQFAAYNRITAPKQVQLYPHHQHENLPGFSDLSLETWRPLLNSPLP